MTLETLANLGEFIGGLAVLISLVYLGVQIRQNTNEVRNAAMLRIMEQSVQNLGSPLDLEVDRINSEKDGDYSPANFTDYEKSVLNRYRGRLWQTLEIVYMQYREGRVTQELLDAYLGRISNSFHSEMGRAAWNRRGRAVHTASFVEFVEEIIAKHDRGGDDQPR